jgi:hypothetical protein
MVRYDGKLLSPLADNLRRLVERPRVPNGAKQSPCSTTKQNRSEKWNVRLYVGKEGDDTTKETVARHSTFAAVGVGERTVNE